MSLDEKEKTSEEALVPIPNNSSLPSSLEKSISAAKNVAEKTGEAIKIGLSKPTASTGKPMDEIHGGAKTMATYSNIGGGSIETGGDGAEAGFKTVADFVSSMKLIKTLTPEPPKPEEPKLIDNTDDK